MARERTEPAADAAAQDVATEERPGAELAVVPERPGGMHLGTPAYKGYDPEMIKLVRSTLMPDTATNADLYMLLELAATYGLDPFTKEIMAAEMKGRNASGRGKVVHIIGRDGLLAIAQRNPDYQGLRKGVVHEKDQFAILETPVPFKSGGVDVETWIKHSAIGFGPGEKGRGAIIGAYAEVYRRGHVAVHFEANLSEYVREGDVTPWKKQPTVMIEKVAIANALRLAFRVSGLYVRDEVTGLMLAGPNLDDGAPAYAEMELHADGWTNRRLLDLFEAANGVEAGAFPEGKQKLMAANLDDQGASELIATLERFILDRGGQPPDPPDPADFVEAEAVEVTTADDEIPFGEPEGAHGSADAGEGGPGQDTLPVE